MRVFLACPMGETILPQTALCIQGMSEGGDVTSLSFSQDAYIDRNHNYLVETSLSLGMDATLFVDSDHEFPLDALKRLKQRNKDIVGCQYRMRAEPWPLMPECSLGGDPSVLDHGCKEVEWLASGLMLVRNSVFEKVSYPWFPNLYGKSGTDFVGSDRSFCRKARGLGGYKIWCDFDLSNKVTHLCRVALRRDGEIVQPGKTIE